MCASRCEASAGDCGPGLECLPPRDSVVGDGAVVAAKVEEVGDRVVDGEKSLDLASRLEAFHLPFSSPRRLVRVLGSIVETLVLTMFDARHGLALGGGVALQLVDHHHPWHHPLSRQQLLQQPLGRLRIPPALDQHVKDKAILVHSPPEILALIADGQDDLIQVPFVAPVRRPSAQGVGDIAAEFQPPLADVS